jgi:hypothetical protein
MHAGQGCPAEHSSMNDVADILAESFTDALMGDLYPDESIEGVFGIKMGTKQGQDMLGAWMTLWSEGHVTAEAIADAQ